MSLDKIKQAVRHIQQVYAPLVGCTMEEKESFEEELWREICDRKIIIMGDLNGHLGKNREGDHG